MSRENLSDTELYFALFDLPTESGQYHVADWPLYRSYETIRLVKEKAASYGLSHASVSMFIRSFNELRAAGAIKPVRQRDPMKIEDAERDLTAEAYFKMSAAEVRRRFAQEPGFRSQVEHLLAIGAI